MLSRALRNDGLQIAIVEMVRAGDIKIEDGTLAWECERFEPDKALLRENRRNAAIVMHCLEAAGREP